MKKLSEYKDEEALDILADLIEPVVRVFSDETIINALRGGNRPAAIKNAIKSHKQDVMEILAILEGVPVAEYHCNVLTLPAKLIELLNDDELMRLFTSQAQETAEKMSSGPVMEVIQAEEK